MDLLIKRTREESVVCVVFKVFNSFNKVSFCQSNILPAGSLYSTAGAGEGAGAGRGAGAGAGRGAGAGAGAGRGAGAGADIGDYE